MFGELPSDEGIAFLEDQLQRLGKLAIDDFETVPELELDVIRQYYDALMTAMRHAVEAAEESESDVCTEDDPGTCMESSDSDAANRGKYFVDMTSSTRNHFLWITTTVSTRILSAI